MKKKIFNPNDWLPRENSAATPKARLIEAAGIDATDSIERAVQVLENGVIDLTSNYADWVAIGFAFAQELGENGRSYFHRVSRFHPEYSYKDCDSQYDNCLKSDGSGISIATFYHHVKQAGISAAQWLPQREEKQQDFPQLPIEPSIDQREEEEEEVEPQKEELPVFPESMYSELPELLQKVVAPGSNEQEKDILLLGAITSLSACLPKVYGIYDGNKVYSNLFLFVTAPASAGKGRLNHCKYLVSPIHKALREEVKEKKEAYEAELVEYNLSKNQSTDKPQKPPEKMLFIPANSSTTGLFQLLHDNDCRGLIFETEGDTLSSAFRAEYSNYSDGFRKVFHHETISYFRRTDREYVNLEEPRLSTVLSGTPRQISSLIPSAENGLFSRFMFYYMNLQPVWKDVFADSLEEGLGTYYFKLGNEFFNFHQKLEEAEGTRIIYSQKQKDRFNEFFSKVQHKYLHVKPEDYVATIRRMGLISFRISMVLSALRMMEEGRIGSLRECDDRDFESSLKIISVLVKHSSKVYTSLPAEKKLETRSNNKERFLEALPAKFTKQEYLDIATKLGIKGRSVERYITQFIRADIIKRMEYGLFQYPDREIHPS